MQNDLTQSLLKQILHYDPETGVFTWLDRNVAGMRRSQCRGKIAGGKPAGGYIFIGIKAKRRLAHRLAWLYMTGEMPDCFLDHIDGDGTNNRFANLRKCNCSQNRSNTRIPKNNKSGVKGVIWHKTRSKWMAQIGLNRKLIYLGFYDNIDDAAKAYSVAAKKYHGEFMRDVSR